jgi:hypothetical protein
MNGEHRVSARPTRAEIMQLVGESVSSGMRRSESCHKSKFEFQHAGSPLEEAAMDEEYKKHFAWIGD